VFPLAEVTGTPYLLVSKCFKLYFDPEKDKCEIHAMNPKSRRVSTAHPVVGFHPETDAGAPQFQNEVPDGYQMDSEIDLRDL